MTKKEKRIERIKRKEAKAKIRQDIKAKADVIKKQQKEAFKKMTFWQKCVDLFRHIKRPAFFIPTIVTWCLIESPLLFSGVMAFIVGPGTPEATKWWAVVLFWYALTAAPLPIPVLPISLAVGTIFERFIFTGRKKQVKLEERINAKAEELAQKMIEEYKKEQGIIN